MKHPTALHRYTSAAISSSGKVITEYSTSFGLASRFLGKAARRDIGNIYALVRLADEIVDGVAHEAGLDTATIATELDRLEEQTEAALTTGYSTNLVVHAFVTTARKHGIGPELTRPFFRSMRADLHRYEHTDETLDDYIYGSAEVVGLMCLAVFRNMPGTNTTDDAMLTASARRLGAAFQKVNFLRDLATDYAALGRSYFPDVDPAAFEEAKKHQLVADIRADLAAAKPGIKRLDPRARIGVDMAHRLFSALTDELDARPADELLSRRVRVNNTRKLTIAAQTVSTHLLKKS